MSLTSAQHQLRWATVPQQSGPKSEGEAAVPLSVAGAGSPSNTMRPASRPTSLPRGIDPSSCLATTYTSRKRLARLLLLERSE